jgi:hypothetical protein
MLNENDMYVVIRFNNGEQVMAVLEEEDSDYVQLLHPMLIKSIPVLSEGREHITAHPFCQFTDDKTFLIEKKNILFVKRLKEMMIPHYQRIVSEHEEHTAFKPKDGEEERYWGHAEGISREEAMRRIEMLTSMSEEAEEREEELITSFVEGNDTRH